MSDDPVNDALLVTLERELREIHDRASIMAVMVVGICRLSGPRPNCICNGNRLMCHASELYGDFAIAALDRLDQAGYTFIKKEK